MITLFIDTSLSNLVIGIVKDNELLYSKSSKLYNQLSEYTLPYIEEAFNICNIKPIDIDNIMVIEGPGSFTGTRIGITIAKTFAWTLKKKIIPISSLKAMMLSVDNDGYVIPIIDAKSDSYYFGVYKDKNVIIDEKYISREELITEIKNLIGKIKVISDTSFNLDDITVEEINFDILKIVHNYIDDEGINPHQLIPKYLKKIAAEKQLM